jgi:hypothetical protein
MNEYCKFGSWRKTKIPLNTCLIEIFNRKHIVEYVVALVRSLHVFSHSFLTTDPLR